MAVTARPCRTRGTFHECQRVSSGQAAIYGLTSELDLPSVLRAVTVPRVVVPPRSRGAWRNDTLPPHQPPPALA
jgi:hypothetical protein